MKTVCVVDFSGLHNSEPLMHTFGCNEHCHNSLLWKWAIQIALNWCSETSQSWMITLFMLSSPIRRVQSSIYLQNYPELWSHCSALLFFTVCPILKSPVHTGTHTYHSCSQHLVPGTDLVGNSTSGGALWFHAHCWMIPNTDTPSVTLQETMGLLCKWWV